MDEGREGKYECGDCGTYIEIFATNEDQLPDTLECGICGHITEAVWYLASAELYDDD